MNKNTISKLALPVIIFIGIFLRLINLGNNPQVLNRDEAALAYSALLLRETGQDEWSRSWPIALESFGDFKLIGYPAILTFVFGFTGYTDFAVRLPSAIAGSILVWLSYILSRRTGANHAVALFVAACTASLGPIFFFSRMAFEAMVALVCWASILAISTSPKPLRLSQHALVACLILTSILTYNTPLAYAVIFGCSWAVFFGPLKLRAWMFGGLILLMSACVFLYLQPLIHQKSTITLFADEAITETFRNQYQQSGSLIAQFNSSPAIFYGKLMIQRYFSHFSPTFLVTRGGAHPWHSLPGSGHFPWLVYFLAMLGMVISATLSLKTVAWVWLKKHTLNGAELNMIFISFWLWASLLPASITVDAPHATRSLLFLFLLPIFAGLGLQTILRIFRTNQRYIFFACTALLLFYILTYQFTYFFKFPAQQTDNFQTGFKPAVIQAYAEHPNQPIAVVDVSGYLYILAAWYAPIKPDYFQHSIVHQQADSIGFKYGERVGPFHFIAKATDASSSEKVLLEPIAPGSGQWQIKDL